MTQKATSSLSPNFYFSQAESENPFRTAARHDTGKGNPSVSISNFKKNQIYSPGRDRWMFVSVEGGRFCVKTDKQKINEPTNQPGNKVQHCKEELRKIGDG